jgi:hypothetical protein
MHEQVIHKALQLASSTRESYLRLVILNHLGHRVSQKRSHDAFGHRAGHDRLRGIEQKDILEPK